MDDIIDSNYLERMYRDYAKNDAYSKANILYNIIAIKQKYQNLSNTVHSLYIDIKEFIRVYAKSVDDLDYGYDNMLPDKIVVAIESLPDIAKRVKLYNYTKRVFSKNQLETDWVEEQLRAELRSDILNNLKSPLKLFKVLISYVLDNTKILVSLFFSSLILLFAMMHPAPCSIMAVYDIEPYIFTDCGELNILMNEVAWLLDIEGCDVRFYPICPSGVIGFVVYFFLLLLPVFQGVINVVVDKLDIDK